MGGSAIGQSPFNKYLAVAKIDRLISFFLVFFFQVARRVDASWCHWTVGCELRVKVVERREGELGFLGKRTGDETISYGIPRDGAMRGQ